MFGTFRKHSTWLWGIIIAAMAVSLVVYFGPGTGNRQGGGVELGSIAGHKISPDEYRHAANEVKLQYRFSRGEWPAGNERDGFDLEAETYKRLFIIHKLQELDIHIGSADVAKVAAKDLQALSKNAGGPVTMAAFEQHILREGGLNLGDYERFLRHSLGVQQLIATMGLGGQLVTPQEARAVYDRENQELSAQAVFFNFSNYLAGVTVTPAAVAEFYTNQMARYRLPDRVQVSYVRFELTNYWTEAAAELNKLTNLNQIVEAEYHKRGGTNYYTDLTPEKAQASIKQEFHRQFALVAARKSAVEFADPLLSQTGVKPEALAARAKEKGLVAGVTAPFDHSTGPAGLDTSENFIRAAFALREDEPIVGPLVSGESVYVIARHKVLPSENPPFDSVKARVENDYRTFQAGQAARAAGAAFAQSATNGLAQGKAFTTLCAEARATPVLLPPFSLSTRSVAEVESHNVSLQQFKQVAFSTPVGKVSPFVPTMQGGLVVYVQSKLELDQKKATEELPEFTKLLRQARQSEAFQEWFSREAPAALADTPAFRPRPSEMNRPPGAG